MTGKLKNFIIGIFPAFVLFVLIPFSIFLPHQEYFNYDLKSMVPFLLGFASCCGIMAVIVILRPLEKSRLFLWLFYLGVFLMVKDISCPVEAGGLFGLDRDIPIYEPALHRLIEALLLGGVMLAAFFIPGKTVRNVFVPILVSFLVIEAAYIIVNIDWTAHRTEDDREMVAEMGTAGSVMSTSGNVYLICLDSFPGKLFMETVHEADLESSFAGFTVFPNNLSNYTFTYPSIASVMSGTLYSTASMKEFEDQMNGGVILDCFADAGYNIWQYVLGGHWVSERTTYLRKQSAPKSKVLKWLNSITGFWVLRVAPTALKEDVWFWITKKQAEIGHVQLVKASLDQLWKIVSDEKKRPANGQFVHSHVYIPHPPFVYDKDCQEVYPHGDFIGQAACSLKPIVALIEQLKKQGKFENATIVIFGDHGTGGRGTENIKSQLNQGTIAAIDAVLLKGNARWLELASSALLLVKPPNSPVKSLKVSGRQTQNIDIAATLADLAEVPVEYTSGSSILSKDFPMGREIHVFVGYTQINEKGRIVQIGKSIYKGEMNHFSFSINGGWRVLPNIPFEW